MIFLSPFLNVMRMSMTTVSFFAHCYTLPKEFFLWLKACVRYLLSNFYFPRKDGPSNVVSLTYEKLWNGAESGLVISMLEKLTLFHFTGLIALVLLMWNWIGQILLKNNLLICLNCPYLLNWIGLLKLSPRHLKPWFALWSFFLTRFHFMFISLPYRLVWITVAISGLVLLAAFGYVK